MHEMNPSLNTDQALRLWHAVFLTIVSGADVDLTMRQMAVLLTIYIEPPDHTVRGLAKRLNISKPAITRALDRLGTLGLVRRKRDEADKRNVLVQRTVKGSVYLRDLADVIAGGFDDSIARVRTAA